MDLVKAKEAHAEKLALAKEKRVALAAAVFENREADEAARAQRHAAALAQESAASLKRERRIGSLADKSGGAFKKALTVAATHKEQARATTESAKQALTIRLEAAEERREAHLAKSPTTERKKPPSPTDIRARVLNDAKVEGGRKQRKFDELMEKAACKREAQLNASR